MTNNSSQNIFEIDSIRFLSNFDSGNLYRIEKTEKKPFEYRLWTGPDNIGSEWESKHCTWFYFTVIGLPSGTTIKFVSFLFLFISFISFYFHTLSLFLSLSLLIFTLNLEYNEFN